MKNDDQSGFILMIIILVTIAAMIIGFAVYRITRANLSEEATSFQFISVQENEPTSV